MCISGMEELVGDSSLLADMAMGSLSELSYKVEQVWGSPWVCVCLDPLFDKRSSPITCQSGLTGCAAEDSSVLFSGDSLSNHLSRLFDGRPQTWSISADPQVGGPVCCHSVPGVCSWGGAT